MSDPPYNLPPITTSLPAIKTDSKNSPQEAAMNQGYSISQQQQFMPRPRLPSQTNPPSNSGGITLPSVSSLASGAFPINSSTTTHIPFAGDSRTEVRPPFVPIPLPPMQEAIAQPKLKKTAPKEKKPRAKSQAARPLNVRDALSYLEMVKKQFSDQPEVYNRFLDIMKDFKQQEIDTPGVIKRVISLFRNQPNLILGFNTFLPPGYFLEPTNDPNQPVKVTTPNGAEEMIVLGAEESVAPVVAPVVVRPAAAPQHPPPTVIRIPEPSSSQAPAGGYTAQMTGASNIITSMNQPQSDGNQKMEFQGRSRGPAEFNHAINYVNKIKTRFASQPEVYRNFLEILQTYQKEDVAIHEVYQQVTILFASAPDLLDEFKHFLPDNTAPKQAQPVRKPTTRKPNSNAPPTHYYSQPAVQPLPPKKKVKTGKTEKLSTAEEMDFFEKCKKVIGNKTTYNEFLKILNLFTQEIIEAKVLIERVEPFLGKAPELFDWFKKFVKYDEDDIIYNIPAEKAPVDLRTCRQSGHSYRRMPNNIPRLACSGRDELARDVLNDDWVSTPVFISESGFVSHKKTPHEEAMYKCEEERYEFDLNIEANLSVIALLEPIAKKIMLMPVEERATFKLPPGLGGSSTTIYKRIIKKVYDSERGLEVIEALHHNPAVAVPIVLKRLKQKDEEWKRSQREWNKVWREIDAKNFSKALDHQGINFKVADRKAILSKSMINEIEVLQHEQREKKSTLANRYQFDFSFKNLDMFKHVDNMLLTSIENNQTVSAAEEEKMKILMQDFLPKFFNLESVGQEEDDSAMDVDTEVPGLETNGTGASMDVDQTSSVPVQPSDQNTGGKRTSFALYANNGLYCFFRLYQMLYARLLRMNEISDNLGDVRTRSEIKNPVAVELGFRKESTEKDRFTELLKDINSFISGELDSNDFEDKTRELFWTSGYLIFTVDKLVQALVKQLQVIATDPKSLELITIFGRDREKPTTGPRQEALYRLCAEQIIQDENMYRLEHFVLENVLTIQLLGKEDHVTDDTITSEEKWSLYVDQFVQLSAAENNSVKRRDPFCKRNLPAQVGEEPPVNVETKSGLELKICVNTYKIFFVDNTEDYFKRKRTAPPVDMGVKRAERFRQWLDGEQGWKRDLDAVEQQALLDNYSSLVNDPVN